jgi:hypothetical protein
MSDDAVLYTWVYDDVSSAMTDLDSVDELHHDDLIGKFDAAVIDQEDGKPHIVKRLDRPRIRIIPEEFGGGTLRRKDLMDAAKELSGAEAALVVVGEPTLEKGLDKAISAAARSAKRTLDASTDELASELQDALKS